MDARKVKKMNKICDKITEAVLPVGMQPDFKQFKEGKGNEFTMTIKFTDKQKRFDEVRITISGRKYNG